jgi:response regulator RpfG family c-di-GMP phosphodiesterase
MVSQPKILIVDDQKMNILLLENLLRKVKANILKAYSGKEALELVGENEFALMVFDVQMPGMDGFELATKVREFDHCKSVPIVFVSAIFTDNESISKGYHTGAVDYLTKPVNPHILISKVEVFLELYRQRQITLAQKAEMEEEIRQLKEEIEKLRK